MKDDDKMMKPYAKNELNHDGTNCNDSILHERMLGILNEKNSGFLIQMRAADTKIGVGDSDRLSRAAATAASARTERQSTEPPLPICTDEQTGRGREVMDTWEPYTYNKVVKRCEEMWAQVRAAGGRVGAHAKREPAAASKADTTANRNKLGEL